MKTYIGNDQCTRCGGGSSPCAVCNPIEEEINTMRKSKNKPESVAELEANGDTLTASFQEPLIRERTLKHEIFNDHFQNYKRHAIPKAQLVIADIPYNIGKNAYGSNPAWYEGGDSANGESKLANSEFFDTDKDFRISEFLHFCSKMLKPENKKETGTAPCMIVFCAFDQQMEIIEKAKEHGLMNYINLVFTKNFSAQVLKANMRVVGNCEYGLILYRDKLPKFNNHGKMVFNQIEWPRENDHEKIHPTQKPIALLQKLICLFTDPGEVVIDPCCGSGSTVIAAHLSDRSGYGFEIKKDFHKAANKWLEREKMQMTFKL